MSRGKKQDQYFAKILMPEIFRSDTTAAVMEEVVMISRFVPKQLPADVDEEALRAAADAT